MTSQLIIPKIRAVFFTDHCKNMSCRPRLKVEHFCPGNVADIKIFQTIGNPILEATLLLVASVLAMIVSVAIRRLSRVQHTITTTSEVLTFNIFLYGFLNYDALLLSLVSTEPGSFHFCVTITVTHNLLINTNKLLNQLQSGFTGVPRALFPRFLSGVAL